MTSVRTVCWIAVHGRTTGMVEEVKAAEVVFFIAGLV